MQGSIDDMVCLKLGIARCRTLQVGWGFGADLIDLHVAVRKGWYKAGEKDCSLLVALA
jgi:hypothetical protein